MEIGPLTLLAPGDWEQELRKCSLQELKDIYGVFQQRMSSLEERIRLLEVMGHQEKHISELGLTKRAFNALNMAGLYTVPDIITYGLDRLQSLRNAGSKTVGEIREVVMKEIAEKENRA